MLHWDGPRSQRRHQEQSFQKRPRLTWGPSWKEHTERTWTWNPRQRQAEADLVGRQKPKESNVEDWGKLMTTYNYDPILIDGFTACWTCALYAGGGNCKSSAILHLMQFSIRWVPFLLASSRCSLKTWGTGTGSSSATEWRTQAASGAPSFCLGEDQMQEPEGDILQQPRANCSTQHCRLTICIELVELTNSIRWQDPNNNTDTATRCHV